MSSKRGLPDLLLTIGGLAGLLAVAFGAFGAHALKSRISPDMLDTFKTGVQYQAIHALALIQTAMLAERRPSSRLLGWAGGLFAVGIVIFSGSLYCLALSGLRVLGAITPLGGVCFMAGWVAFIAAAAKPAD